MDEVLDMLPLAPGLLVSIVVRVAKVKHRLLFMLERKDQDAICFMVHSNSSRGNDVGAHTRASF